MGLYANCTGGAAGLIDRWLLREKHIYQTPSSRVCGVFSLSASCLAGPATVLFLLFIMAVSVTFRWFMQLTCRMILKVFWVASTLSSWLFLDYRFVMFFLVLFPVTSFIRNLTTRTLGLFLTCLIWLSSGWKDISTLQRFPSKYHFKVSHMGFLSGKSVWFLCKI